MERNTPLAITGTGIVCGSGATPADVWSAITAGETSIAPLEAFETEGWSARLASEVKENNRTLVPDRKLHKSISRTDLLGIYAGEQALTNAGFAEAQSAQTEDAQSEWNDRSGLIVGSGGGTLSSNYDYFPLMAEVDQDLPTFGKELGNMVTPMWLLKNLPNNVLCHVGIRNQLKGTNACITNQCASGIMALTESAEAIWNNEADRMGAIAHDMPIEPEMVHYYSKLGLMSGEGLHPFDENHSGTIFGEGAAGFFLEPQESARERDQETLGYFVSYGVASEATGITDLREDGDGVRRAIEDALTNANITADQLAFIAAHGNGTQPSDSSEALGIRAAIGDASVPVTAFKGAYGHLIASSGAVDCVMALEALRNKTVPAVVGLRTPAQEAAALNLVTETTSAEGDYALVICRGFGGTNVAVVLKSA